MAKRKASRVHYRRMDDPVGALNGVTLEAAIRGALANQHNGVRLQDHWKDRARLVPPDETETLLLNIFHDDGASFFGDLTVYTKGFMQSLLREETSVPMLAVEQQPPPKGREYIHSMMYWMAIGNHVMVIQSTSLTTKHLEEYLTWLLSEKTSEMQDNGHVILTAKFDASEVGGDLNDINEIVVGGLGVVQAASPPLPHEMLEREVDRHVDFEAKRSWGKGR